MIRRFAREMPTAGGYPKGAFDYRQEWFRELPELSCIRPSIEPAYAVMQSISGRSAKEESRECP
jgi:hypothetical protein